MIMRRPRGADAGPTGGKVEFGDDETGVTSGEMTYIRSIRSALNTGTSVAYAAFLCRYESGEAHPADPEEVSSVEWLTSEEIFAHPRSQPWTESIAKAVEKLRVELGC